MLALGAPPMDPSWLQAIPANVQRGPRGRPSTARRLASCKALRLQSTERDGDGGPLVALGKALEVPAVGAPPMMAAWGLGGGGESGRLGLDSAGLGALAASLALSGLLARRGRLSTDSAARAASGRRSEAGSEKRREGKKPQVPGRARCAVSGAGELDTVQTIGRSLAALSGLAEERKVGGSQGGRPAGAGSRGQDAHTSTTAARQTEARREVRPEVNRRQAAAAAPPASSSKGVEGVARAETTGASWPTELHSGPDIGPWLTLAESVAVSWERDDPSATPSSDDTDDASSDADVSSDTGSSTSDDEDALDRLELPSVSGRGVVILDPCSGCSELPFRDFMPLSRLQAGTQGGPSIAALQKPAGPPGVWLVSSPHAGCPPTLAFTLDTPQHLLWSSQPQPLVKIVPAGNNSVKAAFKDAGFRRMAGEAGRWDMLWSGKALKLDDFKGLNKNQKVNHFPGTWELGRKDALYRNLAAARRRHPPHFDFLPGVFLLPEEHAAWVEDSKRDPRQLYILKPRSSSRGRGVRLLRKPADLTKLRPSLVQKYVSNPHLIHGYKYDLRLYVVVTSWDPLRVYVYREGLVRFASEKYGLDAPSLRKRCAHITNTSVNNKAAKEEHAPMVAAKWSLSALEAYLESEGACFSDVWAAIRGVVLKTLIAVEGRVIALCQAHVPHRGNCFELYGFDVLLDDALKPWLIEVNTGPALHCPTAVDKEIKFKLIRDMLHLVGFCPYDRNALAADEESARRARLLGLEPRRASSSGEEERGRGRREWQAMDDERFVAATSGRLPLVIQEGESENARRGDFERLYPSPDAESFSPLFETQRFNNSLYMRWLRLQNTKSSGAVGRPLSHVSRSAKLDDGRQLTAGRNGTLSASSNRSWRSRSTEVRR